jgi:hypothetical protein
MEKEYTRKEVEEMCKQSYLRGMMVQQEANTNKVRKPFVEWLSNLIDTVRNK